MKQPVLISFCFALIFALGGIAGWLLKPAPNVVNVTSGNISAGEQLTQRLDASLHFTMAQKESVRPICVEWEKKAAAAGRSPRLRKELFEQYAPRIRQLMKANQLAQYDQMVAEARARHQQRSH